MDCNQTSSSVCGIFQARILEWIAISFLRGSFQLRNRTWSLALQTDSLPTELRGTHTHTHTHTHTRENSCKQLVTQRVHELQVLFLLTMSLFSMKKAENIGPLIFCFSVQTKLKWNWYSYQQVRVFEVWNVIPGKQDLEKKGVLLCCWRETTSKKQS